MYSVVREIQFCYGHRLMNYEGKCRHPHGHNGRLEIELSSERLDERGMVVDFEDIKKNLQVWVDENMDHQMLLRHDDPLLKVLQEAGEPCYVMKENPTAENIAKEVFQVAVSKKLLVTRVSLWETAKSYATYQEKSK